MKFAHLFIRGDMRLMDGSRHMRVSLHAIASVIFLAGVISCSEPLTAREKTAGAGAVVGSTVGAAIGSVSGYAWTGGMAGAALGWCVGAVVGGQVEELEKKQNDLARKIQECDREIQRQSDQLEEFKKDVQGQ